MPFGVGGSQRVDDRMPPPVSRRTSSARSFVVIATLVVLYCVLPFSGQHRWLGAVIGLGALGATVPLVVRLTQAVALSDHPVRKAVESTAIVVTMLIVGFSAAYLTIDADPGQFSGLETRLDSVYFTVTTLSTVGYGDIAAVGQTARAVVTLQILFDLSVLAVAVRVLATAARRAMNRDGDARPGRSTPGHG